MIPVDDRTKFILTVLLLAFLGWWAHYTVETLQVVMGNPTAEGVFQAAGASGLLASLGTLLTLSWQYWFRRAKPNGKTDETKTG